MLSKLVLLKLKNLSKQDQYISSIPGKFKVYFNFIKNGEVKYNPLQISNDTLYNLEDNLIYILMDFQGRYQVS